MRNYALVRSKDYLYDLRITVRNLDNSPSSVIAFVDFTASEYKNGRSARLGYGDSKSLSIHVYFKPGKETPAMKKRFERLPQVYQGSQLGIETLDVQEDMKNITRVLQLIQEIDPIPLSALREIQAQTHMDLSNFFYDETIFKLLEQQEHKKALEKALEEGKKGDEEGLILLAEFYQNKYEDLQRDLRQYVGIDKTKTEILTKIYLEPFQDCNVFNLDLTTKNILSKFSKAQENLEHYLKVLEHISQNHKQFVKMNFWAHQMLLPFLKRRDPVEKKKVLTQLFTLSTQANLLCESTDYFHRLRGFEKQDSSALPLPVKTDPFTLIATAYEHKNKLKELVQLEQILAEQQKTMDLLETQITELNDSRLQFKNINENPSHQQSHKKIFTANSGPQFFANSSTSHPSTANYSSITKSTI